MRKFKLTKNDVKSLENAANMFDNAILRKGALSVTEMSHSGGKAAYAKCDWIECTWCQSAEIV